MLYSISRFKIPITVVAMLITCQCFCQQEKNFPFQNTSLSFEQRVNDLVSRLTLEEKVSEMINTTPAIPRLGIPAYDWWNEVLHGVARTTFKVTVYPQAIAMAATFDTASIRTMADYSAMEGRAIHNESMRQGKEGKRYEGLTYWTPNINIFRDPRWGRGQETYGEDPFLTATMAKAFVHGLQGDDPKYLKAAACAKHYAVHSGPEPLRHSFDIKVSNYDLWNTYLPAFKELVVNAHVAGVMCAYNAYAGQPCCGSDLLMTDILRNQWKFSGYVTSDCWAIDDFFNYHKTHPDALTASVDAVLHGTDVECGKDSYKTLVQAVKEGKIAEKQLDISLRRLFMIRFRLGMFDPPSMVPFAQAGMDVLESPQHKAHSLKMARQSIVLLKNEHNTLPLSKQLKKIAVLGPNADNKISVLGNYNGTPSEIITALQGIKNKLSGTEVVYEKAVNFTNDSIASPHSQRTNMVALSNRLQDVDAIIFIGGISPQLEGEEMKVTYPGFKGGDRTSIQLPAVQTELMKALKNTGKPVVFVMMTGSAVSTPWESANIPAIVNAWYGGQAAGTALADVLFGDYNPAGRLPVTFYKSDEDLPSFEDYSMSNRTYRYFKGQPLYKFGFGLSYTSFTYDHLSIPPMVRGNGKVPISVRVTNSGSKDGEEVVELYISGQNFNANQPIRSLKGFKRIFIKAGHSLVVHFQLTSQDFSMMDESGNAVLIPGKLEVSIGGSLPDNETMASRKTISGELLVKK